MRFFYALRQGEKKMKRMCVKDFRIANAFLWFLSKFRPAGMQEDRPCRNRNGLDITQVRFSTLTKKSLLVTSFPVSRRPSIDAYTSQYAGYTAAGPHRTYTDFPNSYEISFLRT